MQEYTCFNTNVAVDVGVKSAIVFYGIDRDVVYAIANGAKEPDECIFEDCFWIKRSEKYFQNLFPFFSRRQIQTCLKKLENKGYIRAKKLSKNKLDHTKWYTTQKE